MLEWTKIRSIVSLINIILRFYLSIDEFLDQYTPAELERMERKDPLKKFSEKVAIQKTLVGKEMRESSPLRSPERSPKRSSATPTTGKKQ
jgi:hypothetical protein